LFSDISMILLGHRHCTHLLLTLLRAYLDSNEPPVIAQINPLSPTVAIWVQL